MLGSLLIFLLRRLQYAGKRRGRGIVATLRRDEISMALIDRLLDDWTASAAL
jgi:hypothetical protein